MPWTISRLPHDSTLFFTGPFSTVQQVGNMCGDNDNDNDNDNDYDHDAKDEDDGGNTERAITV